MTILNMFGHQVPETSLYLKENVEETLSAYKSPLWNLWTESGFKSITMSVKGTNSSGVWMTLKMVFNLTRNNEESTPTSASWFSRDNVASVTLNGISFTQPLSHEFYFREDSAFYQIGNYDHGFLFTMISVCKTCTNGVYINSDYPTIQKLSLAMKLDDANLRFRAKVSKNHRYFAI